MNMMNTKKPAVYWTVCPTDDWKLNVAATDAGICYVGNPDGSFGELERWVRSRFPGSELIRDDDRLKPHAGELLQYLRGDRKAFTAPSDLRGTDFQQTVWQALREIPYGELRSYSDIARRIGRPAAVRAVGTAIGANPVLIAIPCHRVVGKNGALAGYRGGIEMKRRLLRLEGAELRAE